MAEIPRRALLRGAGGAALLAGLGRRLAAAEPADGAARRRVKIGQLGVGHAHASKLSVYRASPDYEVVGIVEPDPALREKARSQPAFRDLRWMGRDELLEVPGLEAVLVETRVRDLLDTAEACVAAGKHVHLDKPAGQSLPQYRRLLEAAAAKTLLVQMGYMFRYNPAVVLMRQVLARGWLGDPFEIQAVISKVVDPAERRRLAEYPGGIMFELGCHVVDLVVGVLGKPQGVTPFAQHAAKADDGLADNMLAVCRYPHALATVKSSGFEVEGASGGSSVAVRYRGDVSHPAAGPSRRAGCLCAGPRRLQGGLSGRGVSQVRPLRRRRRRHGPDRPRREVERLLRRPRPGCPGDGAACGEPAHRLLKMRTWTPCGGLVREKAWHEPG